MSTLDIKLFRDFRRMWAQSLAIALVVAGGVATLVLAVGSLNSLQETRLAYYERNQFADVFAMVRRSPKTLLRQIAEIPGVASVEGRIAKLALLDIPAFASPATGQFLSLPNAGQPVLNQLYMRSGRLPQPGSSSEVVVTEGFAKTHGFIEDSRFSATLNGRKRELVIVGTALSPEFVYAVGPGDRMPDESRFAVIWMPEEALAAAYDLSGAFSSVTLKLLPQASEPEVIKRLDALLDRYGGQAAYGRRDQFSHAYLNHGMDMLRNMSRTLPPIFLLVAAFLGQPHAHPRCRARARADRPVQGAWLLQSRRSIPLHQVRHCHRRGRHCHGRRGRYLAWRFHHEAVRRLLPLSLLDLCRHARRLCARRGAEPRRRHWRRPARTARRDGTPASRGDATAGPATLPSCSSGLPFGRPPSVAAVAHDGAKHHRSSLPRGIHDRRPFTLHRYSYRLAVPRRHHGIADRRHLLHGRPSGCDGELRRASDREPRRTR